MNNNLMILNAKPCMIKFLPIFSQEKFHSRIFLSGFWFIVSSDILDYLRILKKNSDSAEIDFFFFSPPFFFLCFLIVLHGLLCYRFKFLNAGGAWMQTANIS